MRKILIFLMICNFLLLNLYSQNSHTMDIKNKEGMTNNKHKVIAHYVQWFKHRVERKKKIFDHWQWHGTADDPLAKKHYPENIRKDTGLRDIASAYSPLIGPYDSLDDEVIEYHILTAKAAGIEGFVVDWYGPNNSINEALKKLFDIALKYDFKVGVCYEEKITFPVYQYPKDRQEAVGLAIKNFKYIIDTYGHYKNYLTYNGSPVILMFLGDGIWKGFGQKVFRNNELNQIIEYLNKYGWVFIREHLNKGVKNLKAGFAWVGDEAYNEWFYQSAGDFKDQGWLDLVIGAVNPGFDDTGVWGWGGGPRVTSRNNGKLYKEYWERIYNNKEHIDMVQIVTWNDFEEGTVIEPTYEDEFFYLDKTEEYISKYNGHKVNLKDNQLPFELFQLKKYIKKCTLNDKEQIKKELNKLAYNFFKLTVKEIEKKLDKFAERLNYEFINYYDATDEYEVYLNYVGEEKLIKIFNSKSNYAFKRKGEASFKGDTAKDGKSLNSIASAVDGDISTRWGSEFKNGQWFLIDMKKKREIRCVVIDWEAAFGKEYLIEISTDKKNWQTAYHKKEGKGGLEVMEFKPVKCRYVRFTGIKRGTGWGYSFWEFGVFNKNPVK